MIQCTDKWHPKAGERVYVSHAITKDKINKTYFKFKEMYFIRWWNGCLIVFYKDKLHRLHVRHSSMKPILRT